MNSTQEATFEIKKHHIEPDSGYCRKVHLPAAFAAGNSDTEAAVSRLRLFEDGRTLGPAHTPHTDIRERGGGLFSHWEDVLYFSSSDYTDPSTSQHTYTVTGPKRPGSAAHEMRPRGWRVVPSFVGEPFISRELLDELEQHPESPGKSSWSTRNVLHAFILSLRPGVVLEIGAHIGSASIVMGAALKANDYGVLYCLEPNPGYFQTLTSFVAKAGLSDYVRPVQLFSTAPELDEILREKVELIYLDANHSYSSAYHDLQLCDRLLANNGLILLDDVGPQASPQLDPENRGGVRQALLDFTRGRPDLHVIFLEPPFWLNPCGLGMVCKQAIEPRKTSKLAHFAHAVRRVIGQG